MYNVVKLYILHYTVCYMILVPKSYLPNINTPQTPLLSTLSFNKYLLYFLDLNFNLHKDVVLFDVIANICELSASSQGFHRGYWLVVPRDEMLQSRDTRWS